MTLAELEKDLKPEERKLFADMPAAQQNEELKRYDEIKAWAMSRLDISEEDWNKYGGQETEPARNPFRG